MTTASRRPVQPYAGEAQIKQRFGTLENMTETDHWFKVVLDAEGSLFRRELVEGHITRWQRLTSTRNGVVDAAALADWDRVIGGPMTTAVGIVHSPHPEARS